MVAIEEAREERRAIKQSRKGGQRMAADLPGAIRHVQDEAGHEFGVLRRQKHTEPGRPPAGDQHWQLFPLEAAQELRQGPHTVGSGQAHRGPGVFA